MSEHVALPCPLESIITHYGSVLDIEAQMHYKLKQFELTCVLPELLKSYWVCNSL